MKNKKLIVIGISIAMIMCAAVGCGCGNSETMETVATIETEAPVTIEEVEEPVKPVEEAPAVEESVEKEEEKEEATETIEEADYTKEAEELWGQHSEEFGCNYETFRENYIEERESGSDKETAYETVYGMLKKVEESIPTNNYEIIPLAPQSMYATQSCNIRKGPSTDYERVGSLSYAEEVTIIGKVESEGNKTWYVIDSTTEDEVRMVSGSLLSTTKPQQSTVVNNTNNTIEDNETIPVNNGPSLAEQLGITDVPNGGIFGGDSSAIGDGHGAGGTNIQWE